MREGFLCPFLGGTGEETEKRSTRGSKTSDAINPGGVKRHFLTEKTAPLPLKNEPMARGSIRGKD